jgi:N-acetylglucosamine-6-sulfatase
MSVRIAAGIVLALLIVGPAQAAEGPANVVLIMTDDQTVRDMQVLTRTRAAIAGQGVTFTDYRASFPLCCPARSTMLTGQYAHNHRVLGNKPPRGGYTRLDKRHTLPVAMQQRGYANAHIGKYLNGYERKPFRNIPPGWSNWHGTLRTYRMYGFQLNDNGVIHTYGKLFQESKRLYQTNVLRRIATRFIRGRAHAEHPFFLSVAFLAPHAEIYGGFSHAPRPDPGDVGRLAHKPLPRDAAFDEADMSDKPAWLTRQLAGPQHALSAARIAAITRRFRSRQETLLAVDRAVEAIVDTLRDTGQLRGTYVIFTSDNGFMEGQHRIQSGKVVAYEPATALPLLMRGPGIPAGRTSREPVVDVDLAPTILDMANAPHHGWTIDGRSMLPFAQSPGRSRTSRPRLMEVGPQDSRRGDLDQDGARVRRTERLRLPRYGGVATSRYRYVRYFNGQEELYDMARDRQQVANRVHDPRYRRTRRFLRREFRRLRDCRGAACRRRIGATPGPGRTAAG